MAMGSGSLAGWLSLRYQIDAERATLATTPFVWVPFLVAALAAGTVVIGVGHFEAHQDPLNELLYVGLIMVLVAAILFKVMPFGRPSPVVCTRDGIVWGGIHHPVSALRRVQARYDTVISYSKGSTSKVVVWYLEVLLASSKQLSWCVVATSIYGETAKPKVKAVVEAMQRLSGLESIWIANLAARVEPDPEERG